MNRFISLVSLNDWLFSLELAFEETYTVFIGLIIVVMILKIGLLER